MKGLWADRQFRFAVSGLLLLALLALLAPWVSSGNPDKIDLSQRLLAPHWGAPLGTDELGRDLWARLLYGARVSLGVGCLSVLLMCALGVCLGLISGYYGGRTDTLICRGIDVLQSIPTFFLLIALIVVLGPGLTSLVIVLVLTGWTSVARLVRAEILSLKGRDFTLSARAAGASTARILFRHLLPNAMPPIYVAATFGVASNILAESALSFLGLGVQEPMASWGNILDEGRQYLGTAWWLTFFSGLAIFATTLWINSMGQALQKRFDVRRAHEPL